MRDRKDTTGNWVGFTDAFFLHAYREAVAFVVSRNPESSAAHGRYSVQAGARVAEFTKTSSGEEILTIMSVDAWMLNGEFRGFLQPSSKAEMQAQCGANDGITRYWVDEMTENRVWLNGSHNEQFELVMLVSFMPAVPTEASQMATMDVPLSSKHHATLADYIVSRMKGITARGLSEGHAHFGLAKEHIVGEITGDRLVDANRVG